MEEKIMMQPRTKKVFSLETLLFLVFFCGSFGALSSVMGFVNMLNTFMNTAYQLLTDTVFYIMAIAVIAGAIAGLFTEFGIVAVINRLVSPLMKPLYGLPGASVVGILTTYLSDNPAILTLAEDQNFRQYFKKYQLPALTNIGTSFGMGLIITTFMIGIKIPEGGSVATAVIIGNIGAIAGSIISVRLMLRKTKRLYGSSDKNAAHEEMPQFDRRTVREGTAGTRIIEAMMEGGKNGVKMGASIIPGVLIICSIVLMLTNGPAENGGYTGAAYEGVAFLPWIAEKLQFILTPLFGFTSPEAIAVPVTSLGAAGAAIGLVPGMAKAGLIGANDIAVFTAMCMCWSGYLSTHVAMMDNLKFPKLTGHAILSHTIGGFIAGIVAHLLYTLISFL